MDTNTFECDVAVIGLGPVGAITANLLAHQGLRVVALDREPDVMQVPRGVGIDGEIMRVMQTLGLAASLEPFLKVFRGAQYIDSAGSVVASRPAASSVGSQGWPDRYNVHQPEFEEVLRTALRSNPLIILNRVINRSGEHHPVSRGSAGSCAQHQGRLRPDRHCEVCGGSGRRPQYCPQDHRLEPMRTTD